MYFGTWEAIQRWPIHLFDAMGYCGIRKVKEDIVKLNLIRATSLEGLGALGRLGLEGLLLFVYPNFIL